MAAVLTGRDGVIYEGAAGQTGRGHAFAPDTVCAIYSCTKAVTATACLHLAERGQLDLDAPAARHAPGLGDVQVIEGFGTDGQPLLRRPRNAITTRMLLQHSAGFGYDFTSTVLARLGREQGLPPVASGRRAALGAPLLHDPGERWTYGIGLDWAGQVIEGVTGRTLSEVLAETVLEPLGMVDTAFALRPDMERRRAALHHRQPDGSLMARPDTILPQAPEVQMGGHALYSTPRDYARFLRMWLNEGDSPGGRILQQATVRMAAQGSIAAGGWQSAAPRLSSDYDPFPGQQASWGLAFMTNDAPLATGRPAGSLGWGGLANLHYWIDRQNGIAGIWATQVLPFADPAALAGFAEFETGAYRLWMARQAPPGISGGATASRPA